MFQNGRAGRGLWLPTQELIRMLWCGVFIDEALHAENQPAADRIDESRLQPGKVLLKEVFGESREKLHHVEERPLLLDHRINRDVLECDCSRHGHAFLNLVKDAANVSDVACLSIARVFQGRGRTDILGPVCTENTVRVDYLTDLPMPRSRSVSPLLWGLSASSICCETKS